ncbi:hypothetical protein, partial [Streptomyces sp. NPDC058623]|uniref:hypothetical protein n=1 Tax=Streptomyces sp. NPDC058623 TaxID=3346563 RepID=UPI003658A0D9
PATRSKRTAARIDGLLIAAEHNRARRRDAYKTAKAEERRIRRMKTAVRRRTCLATLRRTARPVLRTSLTVCGTVAFVVGVILLLLGKPGGIELLSAAGAAWGLAAAIPKSAS